jgi:hypothetical protein
MISICGSLAQARFHGPQALISGFSLNLAEEIKMEWLEAQL